MPNPWRDTRDRAPTAPEPLCARCGDTLRGGIHTRPETCNGCGVPREHHAFETVCYVWDEDDDDATE